MYGTTDRVVFERLHLEALVYDSLASNSCITVNNDGHDLLSVLTLATEEVLLGTGSAHHAWIHSLQVRWVSH